MPVNQDELRPFREEVEGRVLPTSEIAKLAATLAYGRSITSPQELASIATQAIALWEECEKAREKRIKMLALYARAHAIQNAMPKAEKYPVRFEDFLRLAMPKKRPEDRLKFYREWLRDSLRFSNYMEKLRYSGKPYDESPIPTDEEVAKTIAMDRERGFDQFWFGNAFTGIQKWLSEYEQRNRIKRAQAGAEALKKKRQKNG